MPPTRTSTTPGRLESFLGLAVEPVLMLTADRRIAAVNQAWETLTGFTAAEVIGLECRPHGPTHPGDLAGLGGSFYPPPEVVAGRVLSAGTWLIRADGQRLRRQVHFWPFHDSNGAIIGILALVRPTDQSAKADDSDRISLREALLDLRARTYARYSHDVLIGAGAEYTRVLNGVAAAVGSKIPLSIIGEPGTGKRFVARLIHQRGQARLMPLLGYDCQAIPAEILERELFGNFSPNLSIGEWGRLVAPEGSTLVIGDILQMPLDLQRRLAIGLDQGPSSARLVATTSGSLDNALSREQIVAELYHAITALVIPLRSLRERIDELPFLAQAFLERVNLRGQVSRASFSDQAIAVLQSYDWPGNLRELAKVIEIAHAQASGERIESEDLPASIRGELGGAHLSPLVAARPASLKHQLNGFEKEKIEEALALTRHNKTKAAQRLGVNRPFLYRRIKELGIIDLEPEAGQTRSKPMDDASVEMV